MARQPISTFGVRHWEAATPVLAVTRVGSEYEDTSGGDVGPYGDLRTVDLTTLIELKSSFGFSALRDLKAETGSGTVTNTVGSGEYAVATTALANDAATLDSAERGRYTPGTTGRVGVGVRIPTLPAGAQKAIWGYTDGTNGLYFGADATGLYVAVLHDGTETKTYQSAWAFDKLDGTGPSGKTLDLSDGNVFQIEYEWYGYGAARFYVSCAGGNSLKRRVLVHAVTQSGKTLIKDPNLPIRVKVENGATATALTVYVGGRHFSVVGKYRPNRRFNREFRLAVGSIGTTIIPIMSFRRKSAYSGASVKAATVEVLSDQPLYYELRTNATLTGASFGTPTATTATETAVESDTSATALSGGEILWAGLFAGASTGNRTELTVGDPLDFDLTAAQPLTLSVRTISGTATASFVLRWREEW